MLEQLYKLITPWVLSNRFQITKNRIIGRLANYIYPIYCFLIPIRNKYKSNNDKIIVSLTSFPARINQLHLCINSILRQSRPADEVILWLANTQFEGKNSLPTKLLNLEKRGLKIRFCDDLRSYKKIYYTAQQYTDKTIITADDDTLYPEYWIEEMVNTARKYPECVICYRAHKMITKGKYFSPYKEWKGLSKDIKGPDMFLMPTGVGGVLYPPHYFECVDFDYEQIKRICPTADDLWLRIIGIKKGYKVVKVYKNSKEWFTLKNSQNESLFSINTQGEFLNDKALKNLIDYYEVDLTKFGD